MLEVIAELEKNVYIFLTVLVTTIDLIVRK